MCGLLKAFDWHWGEGETYLCDTADILISVLLAETQVLVQPETHIVAVQAVGGNAQVQKVLLERGCDG